MEANVRILIGLFLLALLMIPTAAQAGNGAAVDLQGRVMRVADTKQPDIELFVTQWCTYCNMAKAYLDQKGVDYVVHDLENDPEAARRKLVLDNGGMGVPFALIYGVPVRGFSKIAYDRALQHERHVN